MSQNNEGTSEIAAAVAQPTAGASALTTTKKGRSVTDNVLDAVMKRCDEGVELPANYNPVNSLKQAQVTLNMMQFEGRPILEVATNISVANCLMATCLDGLDFSRNHCWFIPRKLKQPIVEVVNGVEIQKYVELTLMEGIYGREARCKRINPNYNAIVNFVKQGDEFEFSIDPKTGLTRIDKHITKVENFDNEIIMAYTYTLDENNVQNVFIMSKKQWVQAWTASSNGAAVAKKYPEDFILRTIIKKATKHIVKSNVGGVWDGDDTERDNGVETVAYTEIIETKEIEAVAEPIAPPKATKKTAPAEKVEVDDNF